MPTLRLTNTMRKGVGVAAAMALVFGLSACGGGGDSSAASPGSASDPATGSGSTSDTSTGNSPQTSGTDAVSTGTITGSINGVEFPSAGASVACASEEEVTTVTGASAGSPSISFTAIVENGSDVTMVYATEGMSTELLNYAEYRANTTGSATAERDGLTYHVSGEVPSQTDTTDLVPFDITVTCGE